MAHPNVNDELVRQVARLADLDLPSARAETVAGILAAVVSGANAIAAAPIDELEPELAFSPRWA